MSLSVLERGSIDHALGYSFLMRRARRIDLLRSWLACVTLFFAALGSLVLTGCAGNQAEFERIAPPVRFATLRETASWCPSFDDAWWEAIDAAYEEYDTQVELICAQRWEPHALAATLAAQQPLKDGSRLSVRMWSAQKSVDAALQSAERALCDDIVRSLPPSAAPFMQLLSARIAFHRATALWVMPSQLMPGPLELLPLDGALAPSAEVVTAATDAYVRMAIEAQQHAATRTKLLLAYLDERVPLDAAEAFARTVGSDNSRERTRATESAAAASNVCREQLVQARAHADELLRQAILRENDLFANALSDATRRAEFLERSDAFLHEPMRSSQSLRALAAMGRRLLELRTETQANELEQFDAIVERALRAHAEHRVNLRASSAEMQRRAYKSLQEIAGPMWEFLKRRIGEDRLGRAEIAVFSVTSKRVSAIDAADEVIAATEVQVGEEEVEQVDAVLNDARDHGLRLLIGSPLSPRVSRETARRLSLSEAAALELETFRIDELKRLCEATGKVAQRLDGLKMHIEKRALSDVDDGVRQFMRGLQQTTTQIVGLDVSANARFLDCAARVAGTTVDDARLDATRLELELLSIIGVDSGPNDFEGIVGVGAESLISPLEVASTMRVDDGVRLAVEAIILRKSDELLAAAREAKRELLETGGRFLRYLAIGDRAMEAKLPPWRADGVGRRAAALRFELAQDIRVALGSEVADEYIARLRHLTQPGLEPVRCAQMSELAAFAGGNRMSPAHRAATESVRARLASLLDTANAQRELAIAATHRWRSQWSVLGSLRAREDWNDVAFRSPVGALLHARINDGDDRALAQAAMILRDDVSAAEIAASLRAFPLHPPRRFHPVFK